MDPLRVRVSVKPFDATSGGYEAEFGIDAIRVDLIAPASALLGGGVKPTGDTTFSYADGSQKQLPFAFARIDILDVPTVGRVIFGPEDTEPTIGNLLFESVGFVIDPDTQAINRRVLRL
jgi:hypothetical protein